MLVPVFTIRCEAYAMERGVFLGGGIEPVALLVATPRGRSAIDVQGREVPVGPLLDFAPSLAETLDEAPPEVGSSSRGA